MRPPRYAIIVLVALLTLGCALRLYALRWNWFMHADVVGESVVTASVQRYGALLMFEGPRSVDPANFILPPAGEGEALKHHGPLWPYLGAGLNILRGAPSTVPAAYLALRILTVLSGTSVIFFSYLLAARLSGQSAGLAVAAWVTVSYPLIDYSGNGAFYAAHGVFYLLWIWIALARPSLARAVLLGAVTGSAYLLNFQCTLLVPAGMIILFFQERSWTGFFVRAAAFAGVAGVIVLPWLVRSALLFGDPFYSQAWQMQYVYHKAGYPVTFEGEPFTIGLREKLGVIAGILRVWLPNNLYYILRKLFIIAPVAVFFFTFGLIDVAFSKERLKRLLPVLAVLVLHVLILASWPVWKFRFFVPILPLIFIVTADQLWSMRAAARWRGIWAGVIFASICGMSVLTYNATPTHTSYYDGAVTQDPFHGSEELDYLHKFNLIPPDYAP